MSSVRDRIRNLQQQPELASAPSNSSSVTQLAKQLESIDTPTTATATSANDNETLSSRVAKFDAAATISSSTTATASQLKDSISTTEQPAPVPTAAPNVLDEVARRGATDNDQGRVASNVRSTEIASSLNQKELVNNTRKMFESSNQASSQPSSIRSRAAAFESTKSAASDTSNANDPNNDTHSDKNIQPSSSATAPAFSTVRSNISASSADLHNKPSLQTPTNKSQEEGLASRAAMFEKRPSNTVTASTPRSDAVFSAKNSKDSTASSTLESSQTNLNSLNNNNNNDNTSQLSEQLAEVKALNNKLVKTLLDLTENYRRLELSRDSLQKRIAELEASAK